MARIAPMAHRRPQLGPKHNTRRSARATLHDPNSHYARPTSFTHTKTGDEVHTDRPPSVTSDGGKPAALARFRIAVQALYRLRARPITAVPSELTLWNRGCPLWRPAAAIYSSSIC